MMKTNFPQDEHLTYYLSRNIFLQKKKNLQPICSHGFYRISHYLLLLM